MDVRDVASRVTAVTVYRSGARITRQAELAAELGRYPNHIRLRGLPLALDDSSVRVRVESNLAGKRPSAADVRIGLEFPEPAAPSPKTAADTAAIEEAELALRRLTNSLDDISGQIGRLRNLEYPPPLEETKPSDPRPSAAQAALALESFRAKHMDVLMNERFKLLQEQTELERRLESLKAPRYAGQNRPVGAPKLFKTATVRLDGADSVPESIRLVVDYFVPGARWVPAYAVRFDRGLKKAELTVRAVVSQNSGEDWDDVTLALSTADAAQWTELPELSSLRIGRKQPAPPTRTGWREPPVGAEALFADYDVVLGRAPEPSAPPMEALSAPLADESVCKEAASRSEVLTERPCTKKAPSAPAGASAKSVAMPQTMPVAAPASPAPSRARMQRADEFEKQKDMNAFAGMAADREMSEEALDDAVGGEFEMEEAPEADLVADDFLNYGNLRLPSPTASERGSLQPVEPAERYQDLAGPARKVSAKTLEAVRRAEQAARSVEDKDLPPGCLPVESPDAYDYAYAADVPLRIPSDGEFHSVPLTARAAESRMKYVVVPRESVNVFRRVELANPLDAPLLPGPADLYVEGDFLLTAPIDDAVPPRGDLKLGLGVEQSLKVARNTSAREESAGLLGGTLKIHHEISVEIKNLLPWDAPLEVRERVPVTDEEEKNIKMSVGSVEPPWGKYEQEEAPIEGAYRWDINVAAGKTAKLSAKYAVEIPSKMELVGGNRREA